MKKHTKENQQHNLIGLLNKQIIGWNKHKNNHLC